MLARARGFTLVELLVVIAIIGILVSLLLPAVQSAREAARRIQCTNNLKQLSLAAHNYQTAMTVFPPGHIAVLGASASVDNLEGWGWHVFLLPYIEQQALYDQLEVSAKTLKEKLSEATADPAVARLFQTSVAAFHCPSDQRSATLDTAKRHFYGAGNTGAGKVAVGKTNYPGALGLYDRPWSGTAPFENNGAFFGNSANRIADFSDGTSNTFLVGERNMACYAGSWAGVRNPPGPCNWGIYHNTGRVSARLNWSEQPEILKELGTWSSGGSCNSCTEGFSSSHPGGGLFALADGSVRFFSDSVEFSNAGLTQANLTSGAAFNASQLGLYQKLGIRNDGQPLGNSL